MLFGKVFLENSVWPNWYQMLYFKYCDDKALVIALGVLIIWHLCISINLWLFSSQTVWLLCVVLQFVEPTYKRYLLAIDVSGSMSSSNCIGTSVTPRVASAAMAMLIARTEPQYHFVGFSNTLVPLNINSTQRLDTVIRTIDQVNSALNN